MKKWIPKFIQKNLAYKSQETVTAADYNAMFNLLITQGDYNSEWLEWLTNEGFAEFFKDLNGEDIKQMIVQAADEQLASLAAASRNKACAHLNNPVLTILDESATTSALELFKPVLDDYGIVGCVSCYSSLVGAGNPHMTVSDLQALQAYGYSVINHGTTKEELTVDTAESVISESTSFMSRHNLISGGAAFAYNNATFPATAAIQDAVSRHYKYAVGNTQGVNNSDDYNPYWLTVIPLTAEEDTLEDEQIRTLLLQSCLSYNRWCIIKVDSSVAGFEENVVPKLRSIIEKMLNKENATEVSVCSVSDAAELAESTINNTIKKLRYENDVLKLELAELKKEVQSFRKITHGPVSAGVPPTGNEGDIHIMYE
jgi:hypothetical protein